MVKVTYLGADASINWLKYLRTRPGTAWIEINNGVMSVVHEYEEQNEQPTEITSS